MAEKKDRKKSAKQKDVEYREFLESLGEQLFKATVRVFIALKGNDACAWRRVDGFATLRDIDKATWFHVAAELIGMGWKPPDVQNESLWSIVAEALVKKMTHLIVDGKLVEEKDLPLYSIRWCAQGPVLYLNGRRVTRKWELLMDEQVEADKHGGNANTE